jgi:hypothetical protein
MMMDKEEIVQAAFERWVEDDEGFEVNGFEMVDSFMSALEGNDDE